MKAFMSEQGVLSIWPESELESYALRCWGERNIRHDDPLPLRPGDINYADEPWMSVRSMVLVGAVSEAMPG